MLPLLILRLSHASSQSAALTAMQTYGGAYWKLDEASGNRVDSNGNAAYALVPTPGALGNTTGKIGNAVAADGTNILKSASFTAVNLQTNGLLVWGWANVSNFTGRKGIIANVGASLDFGLYIENGTSIRFRVNDTGGGNSLANKSGLSLSTGTWYFVWGYYNPVTKVPSVGYNAEAAADGAALANGAKTITDFEILKASATVAANVAVDEVGVIFNYDTSLISSLYNGGAGLTYPF